MAYLLWFRTESEWDAKKVESVWICGAWAILWLLWCIEINLKNISTRVGVSLCKKKVVGLCFVMGNGDQRVKFISFRLCSFFPLIQSSCFPEKVILFCFRKEMSAYYLEHADVDHIQKHFDFFEEEAHSLLALGLPIPAYV